MFKLKTRTDVATEQEKVLQQRESEITRLRADLNNYSKLGEEISELKSKNEEKECTIKSNEQSKQFPCHFPDGKILITSYILIIVISYLNKQLNDLQLRSENTVRNSPQWFSTPNDANGIHPKIPMSTLKSTPLQLGQTLENRYAK